MSTPDLFANADDEPEGTVVQSGPLFYRKHGEVWRLLVMSGSMSHSFAAPEGAEVVYRPGAGRATAHSIAERWLRCRCGAWVRIYGGRRDEGKAFTRHCEEGSS